VRETAVDAADEALAHSTGDPAQVVSEGVLPRELAREPRTELDLRVAWRADESRRTDGIATTLPTFAVKRST
jgi:hypothetical protein